MFSIRTRLMHSLTHTLTVNRELVADSRSSIAAAVSPSTTASFSPFSPSTTTHGLPAIESPAVLTVDEVSYCCDSLRMTTEGHGRESVLGHEPPSDHDEAISEPFAEDSLFSWYRA